MALHRFKLRTGVGPHDVHANKGRKVVRTLKPGDTIDAEEGLDQKYLEKFDDLGPVEKLDGKKGKKVEIEKVKSKDEEDKKAVPADEDHEEEEEDDHEGEEPKDVTASYKKKAKEKDVNVFKNGDGTYFVADADDSDNDPIQTFKDKDELKEWLSTSDKKKKSKK